MLEGCPEDMVPEWRTGDPRPGQCLPVHPPPWAACQFSAARLLPPPTSHARHWHQCCPHRLSKCHCRAERIWEAGEGAGAGAVKKVLSEQSL